MAKSDKNRERDRELDTEIDMEEMDDLTLEDPWGGESSTDDPGGRRPANPSRRIITEGVKGMAEGAMETVHTELERNMPNLGVVASEVKGTYEDILEVKDEISKQLQPLTLSMEKTARKILPRAEKLLPKSWYQKIKSTLDRREDERRAASGALSRSVESERADLISSELATVFQQQLEMNQHNELEDKKRELMDRAVSSTQHRDDQHAYARIYDAVRSIELSHRTHMLAYMKKSLELKYKHLFVAQDTFNLLSRTASVYEGYLQGIVKNTSLPDVMKTNMSDYIRKSRTDKYGTMMADFMSNARKIFFNRIKSSIKNIGSNLQFAVSGIDQTMEGIDMANEMGEMTGDSNAGTAMAARMGGGLLGSLLAAGPTRRLLQKLAPWTRTINGKLDNIKTRAYMGLDKKRAEWSQSGNFFKELIADFLPSINTGVTGSNDLLTKGEDAAAFDKITRQSIVEIIPGYLGKIWHEISMLRTGRDDIEEQGFNLHRRRFTTVSQIQEDIFNDERMFGGKGIQTQAVSRALATVRRGIKNKSPDENTENVLKGKEAVLSKIIANHVQWREHFDPDTLSQFAAAPNNEKFARNSYIQKISKGINLRDFVVVTRAIARGLTNKDGKLNTDLCRNFDNAILDAWQQADSYLKTTPYFTEAMGMRRFMADVDEVSVLEDVLDENGKVVGQAKKIIQKGRRGLIGDSNKINRDLVGERMSRFEAGDVSGYEQGYDSDLKSYLSDLDYVRTRLHEMKDDLKKSGIYKSAVDFWTAASAPFKTPGVPTPGAPGAAGTTPKDVVPGAEGSPDFVGPLPFDKLSKRQQVEFLLRKGDWKGAAAAGVTGVAGAAVDIAKKTGAAVNNVSGVAAKKAGVKGNLKTWAKDAWNWVDKKLDSLPQSPEEVEACIDNLGDQCASLWKKTPKDRKTALKRLRQLEKKLRKRFPKQAAFIDAKIKQMEEYEKAIEDSRVGKFIKATGKYAKKKADPHIKKASDAIGKAVDAAKKKAKEVEQAALKKITKETGIPTKTLSKALRGDKKAIARVKKAAPKVWERIKEEQFSDEAIKRRKKSIVRKAKDLKTSIHESIKEGAKGAGSIFASAKDTASEYGAAFREGAGIKDKVEDPKVEGVEADIPDTTVNPDKPRDLVNDELMKLLTEWRDATTTAHTTISNLVTAIGQQLADGINVSGIGGGGGGGEGTIKRKRYGLFGRAGDAISRGAKGLGGALWSGAKKVGGLYTTIYGSLWRGASKVAGSVYSGATNIARWVTSEVGITPYLDLYVKGQEGSAPILTWRKQAHGKGVVFVNDDGSLGDRVKTTKEIIKSKKQVADPETGNILVSYEDHEKGLWCRASGLSTIARMGMLGIRAYGGIYSSAIKAVGGIGKVVAEGIFGKGGGDAPKFVDVYLKGHIKDGPLVTRRQQVKGFVVFKDGSKLERSSDIHEPVYDITTDPPSILVTEEQIKEGLCDVNGNPLGTSTPGREGLLGKMFNLGGTIAKGIFGKTGLKIVGGALKGLGAMYKGVFDAILGGGSAIGRGIANIGARLFGFDSPNGFGRKAFTGLNTRLDALIRVAEAIRDIAGEIRDNGGTGGGGGSGDGGSSEGSGGPSPKGGPGGGRRKRRTRKTTRKTAAPAESEDTISEEVSSIASADPFDTAPEELARAKKRKAALKNAASKAGKWISETKVGKAGKWVANTKVGKGIGAGLKYLFTPFGGMTKEDLADAVAEYKENRKKHSSKKSGGRERTPSAGTARSGGSSKYTAEARKGKAAAVAGRGKSSKEEHVETRWATEEELKGEDGEGMSLLDYYLYWSLLPEKWRNALKWKFRNIMNIGKAFRKGVWNAAKQGWKGFRNGKGILGKIKGAGTGIKKGYLKSYRSTRNAFKRTMPKSMKKPGKFKTLVKKVGGKIFRAGKAVVTAPVKIARAGVRAATAAKTTYKVKRAAEIAKKAKQATSTIRRVKIARAGTRASKVGRMFRGGGRFGRILRPVSAAIAAGAGALFAKNAVQAASTAAPAAEKAAKSGSLWSRIFGGGKKAAGEAAAKGAEKVAAKGTEKVVEKGASNASKKAATKAAEKGATKTAGTTAAKSGSGWLDKAFSLLTPIIAGADANASSDIAGALVSDIPLDQMSDQQFEYAVANQTEGDKSAVGGLSAVDSVNSTRFLGLDHLILGDSARHWISKKLTGDAYADEKMQARAFRRMKDSNNSVERFIANGGIRTELRKKLGDNGGWDYINPIVGLANFIDGVTNVANAPFSEMIANRNALYNADNPYLGMVGMTRYEYWLAAKRMGFKVGPPPPKTPEEIEADKKAHERYVAKQKEKFQKQDFGSDHYKKQVGKLTGNGVTQLTEFYKTQQGKLYVFREVFCKFLKRAADANLSEKFELVKLRDYQRMFDAFKGKLSDRGEFKSQVERASKGEPGDWVKDPTIQGTFSVWILSNYRSGGITLTDLGSFKGDDWESLSVNGASQKPYRYEVAINSSKLLTQIEAVNMFTGKKQKDQVSKETESKAGSSSGVEQAKDAAKMAASEKSVTNAGTGAVAASKTVAEKVASDEGSGAEFTGSGYGKGALDWDAISKKAVDKLGGPVKVSSLGIVKFREKFADFVEASPEYNKLSVSQQSDADDQIGDIADKIYVDCKNGAKPVKDKVQAALDTASAPKKDVSTLAPSKTSSKTTAESRTYKVGESSGAKLSDKSYGKGVLDYDKIVKDAVKKFGGPTAVSSLGLPKFRAKLEEYVESLPEYNKLDDDKQDHVDKQIGMIASEAYSDCKTEAGPARDKIAAAMASAADKYFEPQTSSDADEYADKIIDQLRDPATREKLFKDNAVVYNPARPDYQTLANAIGNSAYRHAGIKDAVEADEFNAEVTAAIIDKIQEGALNAPNGKVPAKDTGKPEGSVTSGDTVSEAVGTAASSTPAPVKVKAEDKTVSGKPKNEVTLTPDERTKAMNTLSKLIPEIRECMTDKDLAVIGSVSPGRIAKRMTINKRIDDLQEETIKNFVLSYSPGWSQSGATDRKEFVSHSVANVLMAEKAYGSKYKMRIRSGAMHIASYLNSTLKSPWSKELDRLFLNVYSQTSAGSLADIVWKKFHGGKSIAESLPESFKKDHEAALAANSAISTEAGRMDDEVSKLWTAQNNEYDKKYNEFMKSKGYEGWGYEDFYDRGMEDEWSKLQSEWKKTGNKKESWEDVVKAHPELDSKAYKKANPYTKIPRLSDAKYDEAFKSSTPAPTSETTSPTPKKPSTPAEKLGGQSPVASKIGTGEKLSSNDDVNAYVQSIGGVKAVRKMKMWDFINGVKKQASKTSVKGETTLSKRSRITKAGLHAKTAYAKAFGITGQFSARMGELIDPKTDKPVALDTDAPTQTEASETTGQALDAQKRDAAPKTPDGAMHHMTALASPTPKKPDETLLTPPQKPKEFVSPVDLRSSTQAAQNNRVDRVVGALKPAAQVGPTIAAAQEMNSNQLQAVVDSNNELSSLLRSALGVDGLRVAGMETLIGVTASGIGGGGGQQPQIINNNYSAPEDTGEGIDLRKKQL